MRYTVRFAPETLEQLTALEDYIGQAGSATVGARYVDAIITYCIGLTAFPLRGAARDDIMPGLRVTNYRGRCIIAFEADEDQRMVSILGVYYGGVDYETPLKDEPPHR